MKIGKKRGMARIANSTEALPASSVIAARYLLRIEVGIASAGVPSRRFRKRQWREFLHGSKKAKMESTEGWAVCDD